MTAPAASNPETRKRKPQGLGAAAAKKQKAEAPAEDTMTLIFEGPSGTDTIGYDLHDELQSMLTSALGRLADDDNETAMLYLQGLVHECDRILRLRDVSDEQKAAGLAARVEELQKEEGLSEEDAKLSAEAEYVCPPTNAVFYYLYGSALFHLSRVSGDDDIQEWIMFAQENLQQCLDSLQEEKEKLSEELFEQITARTHENLVLTLGDMIVFAGSVQRFGPGGNADSDTDSMGSIEGLSEEEVAALIAKANEDEDDEGDEDVDGELVESDEGEVVAEDGEDVDLERVQADAAAALEEAGEDAEGGLDAELAYMGASAVLELIEEHTEGVIEFVSYMFEDAKDLPNALTVFAHSVYLRMERAPDAMESLRWACLAWLVLSQFDLPQEVGKLNVGFWTYSLSLFTFILENMIEASSKINEETGEAVAEDGSEISEEESEALHGMLMFFDWVGIWGDAIVDTEAESTAEFRKALEADAGEHEGDKLAQLYVAMAQWHLVLGCWYGQKLPENEAESYKQAHHYAQKAVALVPESMPEEELASIKSLAFPGEA